MALKPVKLKITLSIYRIFLVRCFIDRLQEVNGREVAKKYIVGETQYLNVFVKY